MNSDESLKKRDLIHQPYGEHHPYESLPGERTPRDPCAGEVVRLSITISQNLPISEVWCDWEVEGGAKVNKVNAVRLGNDQGLDHWQALLPPFTGGEKVRYRFFAQSQDGQLESDEFNFFVRSWVEVDSIYAIEEHTDRLTVIFETSQPELFLKLTAQSDRENIISLQLAALYHKPERGFLPSEQSSHVKNWGDVSLTLTCKPFRLSFQRNHDGLVLQCIEPIKILIGEDGEVISMQFGFESPADEGFYGFGERFNALDQRGNYLDNHVFGQYTSQGKRTYIPIPFFLSSRGYGVWLETERQTYFDLASSEASRWKMTGRVEDDAKLEMKFFFQLHPHEIVVAFTDLTGKPQLPPSWVFGLWMSSNDWNSQSQVLHQLKLTQDHLIPATVLVIEAWSDETTYYIWNGAQYKQRTPQKLYRSNDYQMPADGLWPDPKDMATQIHEAGMRLVLWQIPVLKIKNADEPYDTNQAEIDQEYAVQQGYVVQKANGDPHRIEAHAPWFPNSMVFDFTNPSAEKWWFGQREYLLTEIGIDGFKTDGGEHIWDTETKFWNGLPGARGINRYPVIYEAAYHRFMKMHRGDDHVLFSRAGYTGVQQVSCHWAGDEKSTWEAYRASILAMLNAGVCGISFIGWDIAGFSGPLPGSDLYLRAAAFSVFCPIMQYHSENNARKIPSRDRTPWNVQEQTGDHKVIPTFRKFANLRMNLMPYIIGQARLSHKTGLPMMRALPLEFPHDKNCQKYPYEYMFGEGLLVAPVVEEGRFSSPVYLPKGDWYDLWGGDILQGDREIILDAPMDQIPVFLKKNGLLPLNLNSSMEICGPVGNSTEKLMNLVILIFPGGETISGEISQGTNMPGIKVSVLTEKDGNILIDIENCMLELELWIIGNEPGRVLVNDVSIPRLNGEVRLGKSFWTRQEHRSITRIHMSQITDRCKVSLQY